MISTDALGRVFQIRIGEIAATAFSFEVDGRQYFTTARHLIGNLTFLEAIEFNVEGQWRTEAIRFVGSGPVPVDIFVFTRGVASPVSPQWHRQPNWVQIGGDVFFLGFPFGLHTQLPAGLLPNTCVPFIKRACVSAFNADGDVLTYYLDGINNQGFSGGPVIVSQLVGKTYRNHVVAVVSGYRDNRLVVRTPIGETSYHVRENTGIIVSYGMEHAVRLARANPIGFLMS